MKNININTEDDFNSLLPICKSLKDAYTVTVHNAYSNLFDNLVELSTIDTCRFIWIVAPNVYYAVDNEKKLTDKSMFRLHSDDLDSLIFFNTTYPCVKTRFVYSVTESSIDSNISKLLKLYGTRIEFRLSEHKKDWPTLSDKHCTKLYNIFTDELDFLIKKESYKNLFSYMPINRYAFRLKDIFTIKPSAYINKIENIPESIHARTYVPCNSCVFSQSCIKTNYSIPYNNKMCSLNKISLQSLYDYAEKNKDDREWQRLIDMCFNIK